MAHLLLIFCVELIVYAYVVPTPMQGRTALPGSCPWCIGHPASDHRVSSAGATQLDERLRWLLPGGSARPWFAQTPSRRAFLARLMTMLLEAGPLQVGCQTADSSLTHRVQLQSSNPAVMDSLNGIRLQIDKHSFSLLQGSRGAALAWLAVEAAPATAFAFPDNGGDAAPADPPAGEADAAAGGGTAQGGSSGAVGAAEQQPDWDRARAAAQVSFAHCHVTSHGT